MSYISSYSNNTWTTDYIGVRDIVWGDRRLNRLLKTQTDFINRTNNFGKSIYDPCPVGWQLALDRNLTFADMRQGITVNTPAAPFNMGATYIPVGFPDQRANFAAEGYSTGGNTSSRAGATTGWYVYTAFPYSDREPGWVEITATAVGLTHNPSWSYVRVPVRCVSTPPI
jgi:hypothetical protein